MNRTLLSSISLASSSANSNRPTHAASRHASRPRCSSTGRAGTSERRSCSTPHRRRGPARLRTRTRTRTRTQFQTTTPASVGRPRRQDDARALDRRVARRLVMGTGLYVRSTSLHTACRYGIPSTSALDTLFSSMTLTIGLGRRQPAPERHRQNVHLHLRLLGRQPLLLVPGQTPAHGPDPLRPPSTSRLCFSGRWLSSQPGSTVPQHHEHLGLPRRLFIYRGAGLASGQADDIAIHSSDTLPQALQLGFASSRLPGADQGPCLAADSATTARTCFQLRVRPTPQTLVSLVPLADTACVWLAWPGSKDGRALVRAINLLLSQTRTGLQRNSSRQPKLPHGFLFS
ncbi:hypothetical protein G6O67_002640 [Ophiocordyceps sinensis]|uniref:Uncharacterized protein n=1 Tax=Ophiocordyceps sinensis TaxID=72228 RepID=A0A8H4PUN5_9HYPO|nr:hypothetical protein G6O67_002640 [Ophiocordyceps sinensis]